MRHTSAASFIAVVALGLLVVPAQADLILSGHFEGDGVLRPIGLTGMFVQNLTGAGDDTTLGSFTIQSQSKIDFSHPPSIVIPVGMVSLIFDAGTLFATISGMGTAFGDGTAIFEADWVFTGGTGLFAGATGGGSITGTIVSTGPTTDSVTASYGGSLSVAPEPSSLTLFALGAATGVGVLVRARGRKKR
jgi:hypothetical protein